MKIYRLYYLEQEYIPSDYVDEDGYIDDYYDKWIDRDITLGYFANKQAINKWIDDHENKNGAILNSEDKYICSDSELQMEEIEVIE